MSDSIVSQAQLNKLAEIGVGKLAGKVGLKNKEALGLAQKLGQKGAGALGRFAGKKLRGLVGFKKGGLIVMKEMGSGGGSAPPPARKRGRPKGSKNKKK